jgi:bacteriorhodopsin
MKIRAVLTAALFAFATATGSTPAAGNGDTPAAGNGDTPAANPADADADDASPSPAPVADADDAAPSPAPVAAAAPAPAPNDIAAIVAAHGFLEADDGVGISFWIISIAMVASTVFFATEAQTVGGHWKTSLHVGMLVTLIAAVHYFYMREYWVTIKQTPIVYRYIDWSLTVPLQMIEFYCILKAVDNNTSQAIFWKLLGGTVIMLAFGYLGEQSIVNPWAGFAVGMAGWGFILFEIFAGEGGTIANNLKDGDGDKDRYVKSAFNTMRFIVSVGWSIYPLGYFAGYLLGQVSDKALNLIYNLADMLNKIWFVLAVWHAAKCESEDPLYKKTGLGKGLLA